MRYVRHILTISVDIPSRNSIIWYHGLEGLGGIDLENDEDENVRCLFCSAYFVIDLVI
jgi:hypothetical protein